MHRYATITVTTVLLAAASSCGSSGGGGTAKATTPTTQPPATTATTRLKTLSVHLTETADEYEDANGKAINRSDGESCPPTHEVASVTAKCWTWSAPGLGAGTFTQVIKPRTAVTFPFTFTLKDSGGDVITGTGTSRFVPDLSLPPHAIGHVNHFPTTIVLTGGTGKFAGIRGTLSSATDFSKVVGVDTKTGIVHKIGGPSVYTGTVTFP
jgi:hypothetical protein